MASAWYCVYTRPQLEELAVRHLGFQGFETFLPKMLRPYRGADRMRPMFPSYLFVAFDRASTAWRTIHSTIGVKRLFSADPEHPIPVADEIIDALRNLEAQPDMPVEYVVPGTALKLIDGSLKGHEGICTWAERDRIKLLLEIMNRQVEVLVERKMVSVL